MTSGNEHLFIFLWTNCSTCFWMAYFIPLLIFLLVIPLQVIDIYLFYTLFLYLFSLISEFPMLNVVQFINHFPMVSAFGVYLIVKKIFLILLPWLFDFFIFDQPFCWSRYSKLSKKRSSFISSPCMQSINQNQLQKRLFLWNRSKYSYLPSYLFCTICSTPFISFFLFCTTCATVTLLIYSLITINLHF